MSTIQNFVLSPSFKVLRKGAFVKPSEAGGEFLYTTGNEGTHLTVGQMEEIAKANKLKVTGKNKSQFKVNLDEELNKMSNVPEQNGPTQTEIVEEIIRNGVEAGKSDDEMLVEIITAGVSFRQAGKLFKDTMERLGIRASLKAVKDAARDLLDDMEFNPQSYEDVEKAIAEILDEVEGATPKQALTAVRSFCRENEIELPKRPAGRRGAVGFRRQIFDFLIANPNVSMEDLEEFFVDNGKKPENAKFWSNILVFAKEFAEANPSQ